MNRALPLLALILLSSGCGRDSLDLESGKTTVPTEEAEIPNAVSPEFPPAATDDELVQGETPPVVQGPFVPESPVDAGPPPLADAGDLAPHLPECEPDFSCPDELYCALSRGVCVECFDTKDCPGGHYCEVDQGLCLEGCFSDEDCRTTLEQCDRRERQCVECNNDDHCFRLHSATRSVCDRHECRPCEEDRECPRESICDEGECRAPFSSQ